MKLAKVRIQNYRSVRDTGWFDIESAKTILVGPNEAGKSAVLNALQRINAPDGVTGFTAIRDYPRKLYNADIQSGRLDPKNIPVASVKFRPESSDLVGIANGFDDVMYCYTRYLENNASHHIEGGPELALYTEDIRKDLQRMCAHAIKNIDTDDQTDQPVISENLDKIIKGEFNS